MNKIEFKKIANKHINDIVAFVIRMIDHMGVINKEYIYEVKKDDQRVYLERPDSIKGEYINGGLRIPGEITNSFCTLYEIGYFINALFLNAVVSALPIDKYKKDKNNYSLDGQIKKDISLLTDEEIKKNFHSPKIPIISWLTDDVETYRFRKEVLWGVKKEVSKKIIGTITKDGLDKEPSNEFYNVLWVDKDKEITNKAMETAENMSQAKMMQYYLAVEEFLKLLGLDLSQIPFYFFSSPYHELLELGSDHEFLELLIALHTKENIKRFSKIVRQEYPILIKIPCPNCGESSKKILQGRIKGGDYRTVRLICAPGEKRFTNEHGIGTLIAAGCGHKWEYQIPDTPHKLYDFLKENSFSLHVTLSNTLQIFKNTAISPIAHVLCDLNINYDKEGKINIFSPYPRGYGSSAELFTSVMGVQLGLLNGILAKDFIEKAKQKNILVDNPFMIFAHQSPTTLYDPTDIYENILKDLKIEVGPQDTSIWKVLQNGMSPEEVVRRSIDITYYPAEKMYQDIRGYNIKEI